MGKPIKELATRQVIVDPRPGDGIALDHLSLLPANAMGSGTTASNVFLAGDRSWRTVGGGGGGTGNYAIVASNTTFANTTVSLSGFGAATVNTAANIIRISVPTQTAETAISGVAASNTTYTSGTITITGVGGGITVSSNTGQRIDLSVAAPVAQTVQTQSNIQGIAASNTTYNTGTVTFTGVGGGVTVSSNTGQRVDISVAAPVAQTVQTQNMVAISASDTLYSSGTVTITGSNAAVIKSGAAQGVVVDVSKSIAGITAGTGSFTSGNVSFSADGGNITIDNPIGQVVRFSVTAGGGGGGDTVGAWKPILGLAASAQNVDNARIQFRPMNIPTNLTAHRAGLFMWNSSGATGSTAGVSWAIGLYTLNVSTLSLATSASSSSSWTSGSNAASNWSGVSGVRRWDITNQTFNISPGDYVAAMWVRTTNAGSYAHLADSGIGSAFSGVLGSAPNKSILIMPHWGAHSVTTAGPLPNSIGLTDIQNSLAGANERMPDFMLWNSTWNT